jgi:hypothetical protein
MATEKTRRGLPARSAVEKERSSRQAPVRLARSRPLLLAVWSLSAALLGSPEASARPRSEPAQAEFQRLNPCPANDARRGTCPGYVIGHVVPLCLGGPDVAYNMRWQPIAEAKAKDVPAAQCRTLRNEAASATSLDL